VIGTNPAASLPDADKARAALKNLELLIVSDNVLSNDTINAGAHVLLPALAWGEKDGAVTNSERRISRQRAFLPAPGDARADWAIFAQLGRRMGFSGFDFRGPADVFREHAALSAFENDGARDFDLGGLAGLSDEEYDALSPTQWPIRAGERSGRARLFSDGGFFTPDRRARFVAPEPPALKTKTSSLYPLRLNTGRVRDQWHTMTRTGASPRLARHLSEPFIDVNDADAKQFGVKDGGFADVSTLWGTCVLRVIVTDRQPRGQIFAPIHWTDATSSNARIGALVAPFTDPISGQPEAKATPAVLAPRAFAMQSFLLARQGVEFPSEAWWTRAAIPGGSGYRIASNATIENWRALLRDSFSGADVVEYVDEARGVFRAAGFEGDRLDFVFFIGPNPAPGWDATLKLFAQDALGAPERRSLLSGRGRDGGGDDGPVICACFGVGEKAIGAAIAQGCDSPLAVGAKLRAGTNCGSCIPEIKRLIAVRGRHYDTPLTTKNLDQ
jgi:assimilatory nitrate reductase catalytic subunit